MKRLTCEMCGSNNLIKQEGMYVCQNCGTQYSVEEAKKMMIEGTVDVTGTVKVDSSDKLKNLYQIARRAKDDNNGENAAKYYDMILIEDPTSWEATFYVVYFKALECKIFEIQSAAISVSNCIDTVLKIIKEYVESAEEQEKAASEVAVRVMMISELMYSGAKNHYTQHSTADGAGQEYIHRAAAVVDTLYNLGNQLEGIFGNNASLCKIAASAWKEGITKHCSYISLLAHKENNKNIIMSYADKIKKYDSSYQAPSISTSGCYIATSVYGSYDCPEVWTLRRYRDFFLSKKWYGRLFIKLYYAISPTIIRWFGKKSWFGSLSHMYVDNLVTKLHKQGYEDTPYSDVE